MAGQDLYAVLGLERGASVDDVKRAYRKLARKWHPDVNPGDAAAEERFKEISAAFDVLGDSEKRKAYDEFGEDGLRSGFDPTQARAYREWRSRADATTGFRRGGGGSGDVFSSGGFDLGDLFGDLAGGAARPGRADRRAGDIHANMSIPFRDAILGTERELAFTRPTPCDACSGTGHARMDTAEACAQCGGSGHRSVADGPVHFRIGCAACGGTGKTPGPPCVTCGGRGRVEQPTRLRVRVPAGVADGQTIRLAGKGIPGVGPAPAGDLFIRVAVAAHPLLHRQGRDLSLDVPITVREAMLGATIEIPTLDGTIKLTVPAGVQNGTKLRVKGRGVSAVRSQPAGDYYVVVRVQLPAADRDPAAARRAADELERLYETDVRATLRV